MIRDFVKMKRELKELATIINSFKSEAVQLRIVEHVLGDIEEPEETTESKPPKGTARKKTANKAAGKSGSTGSTKRTYLSQSDVPAYSLAQAIRIPRAIGEHYAFQATTPLPLNADPLGGCRNDEFDHLTA